MASSFKKPKETPPLTTERARNIVDFIALKFGNEIPKTCLALNMELARCAAFPTAKLIEWLNVIANLLKQEDGKMVMTQKKADTIEFIIAGY